MFILLYSMFVSVVLDPGEVDSAKALATLLTQYGFTKIQRACWEHTAMTEKKLTLLKKSLICFYLPQRTHITDKLVRICDRFFV